jgi:hypothetical protein
MQKEFDLGKYYTTNYVASLLGVTPARVIQLIGYKFEGEKLRKRIWIVEKESFDKYFEAVKIVRGIK